MTAYPKEIQIDGRTYTHVDAAAKGANGPLVVIRTYSAGVHIGELVSHEQKVVVLANSRRLWKWAGAFTLNEVATKGVASGSRISAPVASITLTEAIEIIPVSETARSSLTKSTE